MKSPRLAHALAAGVAVLSPTLGGWLAWLPALPTLGVARVARALAVVPVW